ncbi:MAG: hypothetical protein HY645_13415 [Acidobacteria bacterium]|nr:hypothetical protein [Acidobacteriota bacterium]
MMPATGNIKGGTKAVSCPYCGSGDFEVWGVVEYSKSYSSDSNEYGPARLNWDFEFPTYAECAGCKKPVTEYLQESAVIGACYDVRKRKRKRAPGPL